MFLTSRSKQSIKSRVPRVPGVNRFPFQVTLGGLGDLGTPLLEAALEPADFYRIFDNPRRFFRKKPTKLLENPETSSEPKKTPWVNVPEARSSTGPQTARCSSTGTASSGTVPRPRLAELKPLLKDLFEEQAEAQDAQQLQSKIDQLQKLQQILQLQQEGLKQQQKVAQSYQPKVQRLSEYHPPARGYSASITSPRGANGVAGAVYPMSFMLPLMEEIRRSPVEVW